MVVGAPTDEQAVAEVVAMGFEQTMVESIVQKFRRAKKTSKDVLTSGILARLVLDAN